MKIDDKIYACELEDILDELQKQLRVNRSPYLQKGYKRSGSNLQVQCPFHSGGQERNPSAGIRRSDGMFHCFACGKAATLPEFVTACFQKNDIFGEFGRRWLSRNFLSLEVENRKPLELDFTRREKKTEEQKYVTEEELDQYRYYHPYWTKRGITDEHIIELFDLGYDRSTKCITFPVRDIRGNCLFIARRSVSTKFFSYPEGVTKPLYGLYEYGRVSSEIGKGVMMMRLPFKVFDDLNEVIVCESMIDCILLWQAGHYAVALNGTGNKLQMQQLKSMLCRKLILATDNDEAGLKARKVIREAITNKLITEIQFPKSIKDIGECTPQQIEDIKKFEVF